jgi:hypothetical protein
VKAWLLREELGDLYPVYKNVQDFRHNQGILARMPFDLIVQ